MKTDLIQEHPTPIYEVTEIADLVELSEYCLDGMPAERVILNLPGDERGLLFETKREQRMFGAGVEFSRKHANLGGQSDILDWVTRWLDVQLCAPGDEYREEMIGEKNEIWARMTKPNQELAQDLAGKIRRFVKK